MKNNNSFSSVSLTLALTFILAACSSSGDNQSKNTPIKSQPSFRLVLLAQDKISWPEGSTRYTWEMIWPRLQDAYPSAVDYSIEEADVESYYWTEQIIVLTPQASDVLFDTVGCEESEREYPYFCLSSGHNFLVVVDGEPLYGGEFSLSGSSRPIDYPTIYLGTNDKRVVFEIHDAHSVYYEDVVPWATPGWGVMEDERIKTIFSDLGKSIE